MNVDAVAVFPRNNISLFISLTSLLMPYHSFESDLIFNNKIVVVSSVTHIFSVFSKILSWCSRSYSCTVNFTIKKSLWKLETLLSAVYIWLYLNVICFCKSKFTRPLWVEPCTLYMVLAHDSLSENFVCSFDARWDEAYTSRYAN